MYDYDFDKFVNIIRNLKIKDLPNVYKDERYDITLQEFGDYETYSHRKLGKLDIFHKIDQTTITFKIKDVYTVIYYVYLVLGFHCNCACTSIILNDKPVNYSRTELEESVKAFAKMGDVLQADNSLVITFGKDGECSTDYCTKKSYGSCVKFENYIVGLVTPDKSDHYYINKELNDSLKEGRRQ